MGLTLFIAFLITPLIEIAVFLQVGGIIGVMPTLLIVILTALLGAALWRAQGLATWARAQDALNRGELPINEVANGAFLIVAGALLLTPGFVTDAIGFLLFVPPVRQAIAKLVFEALRKNIHVHATTSGTSGGSGPVIEGEATEIDDTPPH